LFVRHNSLPLNTIHQLMWNQSNKHAL
jgi:hypothetical protein